MELAHGAIQHVAGPALIAPALLFALGVMTYVVSAVRRGR
jgi:hypothetical protein